MSGELAYRVAFTVFRIPLTAVLALLAAAAQCGVVRGVRPLARRWIIAAAVGACVSTLIWLPSSLMVFQIAGSDETVLRLLTVSGAGLLSCLVSLSQRRAARRDIFVPGSFVAVSVLAAVLGVVGALAFW